MTCLVDPDSLNINFMFVSCNIPASDEESEEESDDESDWSESEEESDSEAGGYDLDVCPQGCDQNLYDNTCSLREKRLDIEELLTEEKKNREMLNKEQENLQKKARVIDSALKSAENELEAFQVCIFTWFLHSG